MFQCGRMILLAALAAVIYSSAFAYEATKVYTYPTINPPADVDPDAVARGEYLVKASDCLACHSVDDSEAYAGGLGLDTPFGTYYSPNITPDKETGIGSWTEEQFIRALKWGIGPHGKVYFPVFPYVYYNKFTDEQAADIWAYFRSIPAVKKENKPIEAFFLFRIRPANLLWNMLFFYPYTGAITPDKSQSDAWNRGRFLVKGPAHCDMCHTPINPLGGLIRSQSLLGSDVSGAYAPNLTATTLENFSVEEVYRVFAHNELPGGGQVKGPMMEANMNSLRYLTKDDQYAIATYIKSLPARKAPAKTSSSNLPKADPVVLEHYQTFCSGCHDMGSGGAPKFRDPIAWATPIKQGKETLYKNAINGINSMPAKGLCATCTDDDIHALVDFMVEAASGDTVSKKPVGPEPEKPTLELGQKVYDQACASCHESGENTIPKRGDKAAWKPLLDKGLDALIAYATEHYNPTSNTNVCPTCSDTDLIAAVKYIAQTSQEGKDYALW